MPNLKIPPPSTEREWRAAIATVVAAPVTDNAIAQMARLVRTAGNPRWVDRHKGLSAWLRRNKDAVILWAKRDVTPTPVPVSTVTRRGRVQRARRARRK